MTPARLDLKIIRGITYGPLIIACKDAQNAPVDLTGWRVFAQARNNYNFTRYDLTPTITDAPNGQITITRTDEQTATLNAGNYQWDLILERPTGEKLGPFLIGSVEISNTVTQTP